MTDEKPDRTTAGASATAIPNENASQIDTRFESIEKRLNSFGPDIEKLKKSDENLIKKAAVILGVLGALVAIPKGISDSIDAIRKIPRTTMDWGAPVTIHYDSASRQLRFGFPTVISNEGNAEDTVENLSAEIYGSPDKSKFSAEISDFELMLGSTESTQLPLPLTSHQPKQLHITLVLPQPFSERALSFDGQRRITVTFITADHRKLTHDYCFDLDRDQAAEILVSQDKSIRTPECD